MNFEAYFKITYGLYIISSGNGEHKNGYIANTAFQVTAEPPQIAISCNKSNFTTGLIQENRAFSISVLHKDTKADIIGAFGYRCGRDFNKFENIAHFEGKTGIPVVTEDSIAWFECRLTQSFDVGTHILFVGEIIDFDLLNEAGEPLTYAYYRDVKKGKAPKNAPTYIDKSKFQEAPVKETYYCPACGFIYNPEKGDPDSGIAPGTPFEKIPDDWCCPVCGIGKADFVKKITIK